MASTNITTFQDACELLFNVFNPAAKPPTGRELIAAKHAVLTAYRELPQMHRWSCFKRRTSITTDAPYSTGTVAYDHTGGTYERQVTLTSGTWPTNAALGVIQIGDVVYSVNERKSGTVLTLSEDSNPGADVAAGTPYLWYRDSYTLPVGFRKVVSVGEPTRGYGGIVYISPEQLHEYTSSYYLGHTGQPDYYTVRNSSDYIGAMEVVFSPAPSGAYVYDMLYDASPRELNVYKEATGTVTITGSAVAVTGSGTAFKSIHSGSIIRLTDSTTLEPTSIQGHVDGTVNPYLAQRSIVSVDSTTALTLDSAVSTSTLTGVKFVISDQLDFDSTILQSVFEALAMSIYARTQKREDAVELDAVFRKKLIEAMEFDIRSTPVRTGYEHDSVKSPWGDVDVR